MKLGGIPGKIAFEGNLTEFMPFFNLGQWVNLGNGTSFGLGICEIVLPNLQI